MDKIKKFLLKLSAKEREAMLLVLLQIKIDFSKIPGVIKMKDKKDFYRVRVGNYRIIFKKTLAGFEVMRITSRNEKTYKNL